MESGNLTPSHLVPNALSRDSPLRSPLLSLPPSSPFLLLPPPPSSSPPSSVRVLKAARAGGPTGRWQMNPAVAATGSTQVTQSAEQPSQGAPREIWLESEARSAPNARVSAPGAVPGRVGEH